MIPRCLKIQNTNNPISKWTSEKTKFQQKIFHFNNIVLKELEFQEKGIRFFFNIENIFIVNISIIKPI